MTDVIKPDQILSEVNSYTSYAPGIKSLVILFLVVLFILSSAFKGYVIDSVQGATNSQGNVTSYGSVVQGIFIVIVYAVLSWLDKYGVV